MALFLFQSKPETSCFISLLSFYAGYLKCCKLCADKAWKCDRRLELEHAPHLDSFKQSLQSQGRGWELGPGKLKWISSSLITRLGLSINRPPSPLASFFKEVTTAMSCSHPRFRPETAVVFAKLQPPLPPPQAASLTVEQTFLGCESSLSRCSTA